MNNDLFVERNSSRNARVETKTKGRGCLSVIVTAPVFGLIVGFAVYALGYGTTNAIWAALATVGIIFGLYLFTLVVTIGLFLAVGLVAGLLGIFMALWFGVTRR